MWLDHIEQVFKDSELKYLINDLPLAIFMIKLLSVKMKLLGSFDDTSYKQFISSPKFNEFRYYLQVTIHDEINQDLKNIENECEDEIKMLDRMFKDDISEQSFIYTTPSYEDRIFLIEKYNLNKLNKDLKERIKFNEWKEDFENGLTIKNVKKKIAISNSFDNKFYYNLFTERINRKKEKYRNLNNQINTFLFNKFNTKEKVLNLCESIRDVKVSKLINTTDNTSLNF